MTNEAVLCELVSCLAMNSCLNSVHFFCLLCSAFFPEKRLNKNYRIYKNELGDGPSVDWCRFRWRLLASGRGKVRVKGSVPCFAPLSQ